VSPSRPAPLSARVLQEQGRYRRVGLGLLLAGVLGSAAVFALTSEPADDYYMPETKKGDYQMEVIAGKGNMLAAETSQWVSDQWHGRPLARTILVLCLVSAAGCFFIAHRLQYGPAAAEGSD
jgi:hypothetical protein